MDYELIKPHSTIAENVCKQYGIDPKLMLAVIYQESRGDAYAWRYEAHYRWTSEVKKHAKANKISEATEEMGQKFSYGLTQLMGGTARWLGYEGPLPGLFLPPVNIKWSAKYLSRLLVRCASIDDALACYNAGSVRKDEHGDYVNKDYVDSVKLWFRRLKGITIV